ncbi:helix-turn-helix domain-containing protein [Natronorubrum sp. FCH18a]|uniref:helix-turn-helix domain-containing protein n=1 Tax=Natronorubrum sp. FCH18a TaxID=3447018 RepID=UPI003F5188FB
MVVLFVVLLACTASATAADTAVDSTDELTSDDPAVESNAESVAGSDDSESTDANDEPEAEPNDEQATDSGDESTAEPSADSTPIDDGSDAADDPDATTTDDNSDGGPDTDDGDAGDDTDSAVTTDTATPDAGSEPADGGDGASSFTPDDATAPVDAEPAEADEEHEPEPASQEDSDDDPDGQPDDTGESDEFGADRSLGSGAVADTGNEFVAEDDTPEESIDEGSASDTVENESPAQPAEDDPAEGSVEGGSTTVDDSIGDSVERVSEQPTQDTLSGESVDTESANPDSTGEPSPVDETRPASSDKPETADGEQRTESVEEHAESVPDTEGEPSAATSSESTADDRSGVDSTGDSTEVDNDGDTVETDEETVETDENDEPAAAPIDETDESEEGLKGLTPVLEDTAETADGSDGVDEDAAETSGELIGDGGDTPAVADEPTDILEETEPPTTNETAVDTNDTDSGPASTTSSEPSEPTDTAVGNEDAGSQNGDSELAPLTDVTETVESETRDEPADRLQDERPAEIPGENGIDVADTAPGIVDPDSGDSPTLDAEVLPADETDVEIADRRDDIESSTSERELENVVDDSSGSIIDGSAGTILDGSDESTLDGPVETTIDDAVESSARTTETLEPNGTRPTTVLDSSRSVVDESLRSVVDESLDAPIGSLEEGTDLTETDSPVTGRIDDTVGVDGTLETIIGPTMEAVDETNLTVTAGDDTRIGTTAEITDGPAVGVTAETVGDTGVGIAAETTDGVVVNLSGETVGDTSLGTTGETTDRPGLQTTATTGGDSGLGSGLESNTTTDLTDLTSSDRIGAGLESSTSVTAPGLDPVGGLGVTADGADGSLSATTDLPFLESPVSVSTDPGGHLEYAIDPTPSRGDATLLDVRVGDTSIADVRLGDRSSAAIRIGDATAAIEGGDFLEMTTDRPTVNPWSFGPTTGALPLSSQPGLVVNSPGTAIDSPETIAASSESVPSVDENNSVSTAPETPTGPSVSTDGRSEPETVRLQDGDDSSTVGSSPATGDDGDDSTAPPAADTEPRGSQFPMPDETGTGLVALLLLGGVVVGRSFTTASTAFVGTSATTVTLQLRTLFTAARRWLRQLLLTFGLFGYSRYDDTDPLEHEKRVTLHETIEASPGINLTDLTDETGVSRSTARYHLRVLERENLVVTSKIRGKRRYYLVTADDHELVASIRDESTAAVLEELADRESATGSELADELGRDPSTVTHHLSRLEDADMIERERDGRAVVNRLTPDARTALAIREQEPPQTTQEEVAGPESPSNVAD